MTKAKNTKPVVVAVNDATDYKMPPITHKDLLTSEKSLKVAFDAIRTTGRDLQRNVHIAACSVLKHIEKHSDIRLLNTLFSALPESYRTNALRSWFEHFGPIAFEKNKPVFVKGKGCNVNGAMVEPFWTFKPEAQYVPVNPIAAIEKLMKKIADDQGKSGANHGAVLAALDMALIMAKGDNASPAELQHLAELLTLRMAGTQPARKAA